MDFNQLLDYIVPIFFVVIFLISKIFGSKEEVGEEDSEPSPYEDLFESEESVEEEIKRKIHERQYGGQAYHGERPVVEPRTPASSKYEVVNQGPVIDYEAKLREQRKRLKESVAVLEAQKKKAEKIAKPVVTKTSRSLPDVSLAFALKDKKSIRQAILTYEVIGSPLSLRTEGKQGRSWEN